MQAGASCVAACRVSDGNLLSLQRLVTKDSLLRFYRQGSEADAC